MKTTRMLNYRATAAAIAFAVGAGWAVPAAAQNAPVPQTPIPGATPQDALPSLSDGIGREVFETAITASWALDHHIEARDSAVWGQVAVRGVTQEAMSSYADGYDSDQLIFSIGADVLAADDVRVGVMASYANIQNQDLRLDSVPTNSIDAHSIMLGGYVAIDVFERGFANGEIAYLTGSADTARSGSYGSITSEVDFSGFVGRATFGYDLLPDANVSLTPNIGVNFARVNFDDAQETGGFNFLVERGDAEYSELRGGIKFGALLSDKVRGFISGTVIKDLEDSRRSFRLSSAQLPTFFAELPLRERDRLELSAGLTVGLSDTILLDVGYHGDFNDGYSGHAARANVRIAF